MLKSSKRILIVLVVLVVCGAGVIVLVYPQLTRCYLVAWSDFEEISPNLYVSPDMPQHQRVAVMSMKEAGQAAVAEWFGEFTARVAVIASPDKAKVKPFGTTAQGTGLAHSDPFTTHIVLGPNGLNTDVLTHELAHAQLRKQVGPVWLRAPYPRWFDEGLATQFDNRPEISEETWRELTGDGTKVPANEELFVDYREGWNWQVHYGTARFEVGRWLGIVGREGLLELLAALDSGETFERAYERIENARQ